MRRISIVAAGLFVLLATGAASPALAGYGALAYDDTARKYGFSWNEATAGRAEELALKDCGGAKTCKVVFRTGPKQCGAIATAETGNAWGASDKGDRKDTVELRAIESCQKRASGQCKVRASACNR